MAVGFLLVALYGEFSHAGSILNHSQATDLHYNGNGLYLVLILLAIFLLNAMFVAAETAVDLLKPMHVKHIKEKDERRTRHIQKLFDNRVTYVAACKIGSDLALLLVALVILLLSPGVVEWLASAYPNTWSLSWQNIALVWLLMMIPIGMLNLIVELVPRSYASLHPHGTALRLYRFIQLATIFHFPAKIATTVAELLTARFGGRASFTLQNQAEEEIKNIVESAQESGEIEIDEKELLHSVFEFTDTVAREVMTPRVDIDAMPVSSTPQQIMELVKQSGHSRIPIFEETDDQIVGIIHAKDLLMAMLNGQGQNLRSLMRPAIFVPENKNLHELLAEMRSTRSQMAVVQDEFGGTAGIVTIEDIVEELVGDIVDEYDIEEPEVIQVSEECWLADGKTHIDDLNDEIKSNFSSEEFDTVGGMVFGLFGRQPKQNESISSDGYLFTVAQTDGRRIHKLRIEKLPESTAGDEDDDLE